MLIICSIISSYDQVELNREYVQYLPEDLAENIEIGNRSIRTNLFGRILLCSSFAYLLYLHQLSVMKMIIERTMVSKQEKELTDWIATCNNGVVVYEVK